MRMTLVICEQNDEAETFGLQTLHIFVWSRKAVSLHDDEAVTKSLVGITFPKQVSSQH